MRVDKPHINVGDKQFDCVIAMYTKFINFETKYWMCYLMQKMF